METIAVLYKLLAEQMDIGERMEFYYERGIVKKESERMSSISMIEEYEQLVNDERRRADEAEQQADEAEQRADEAEQQADEAEQRADEAEQRADEAEQQADEAEQQKTEIVISFCREMNLDKNATILKLSEKLSVSEEDALALYEKLS